MGLESRSLPLERELVERVVVLLTTYANYGMEAFYANGERTPNSILADEVASKFSAVLAAHAPEPQPLTGEACARIYDEAKACARSEKPVEADYKIHETALVHVYAAGQRSIAAASEKQACKATPSSYGGGAAQDQRWNCEECGDVTDTARCPKGRQNETLAALAAPSSDSPTNAAKWEWPVDTVGRLIENLRTLPPAMPFYTAYFVEIDGVRVARTTHPSLSRETVSDGRIQKYSADKQSLVLWATAAPSATLPPNDGAAIEKCEKYLHDQRCGSVCGLRKLARSEGRDA